MAILLVAALGASLFAWNLHAQLEHRYTLIASHAEHAEIAYDRELARFADFAATLDAEVAGALASGTSAPPVVELTRQAVGSGYVSVGARDRHALGSVSGEGPLPQPGSPTWREIQATRALNTVCQVVLQRNPDIPWCYYTSARRFIYLYPYSDRPGTYYSDAMLNMDFFRLGRPRLDPTRRQFWTPMYVDLAGKGWMATVSDPVYAQGRFIGVASIDVTLGTFLRIGASSPIPNSRTLLFDGNGKPMHGDNLTLSASQWLRLRAGHSVEVRGEHIIAQPIPTSGWWLVTSTNISQARAAAVEQALTQSLAGLFILLILLLLWELGLAWRRVRALAIRDGLTGLYNRRHYDEISRALFAQVSRNEGIIGLAVIDIDEFKAFNDANGHAEGDRVLKAVALALQGCLRRDSDYCFRVGGEEFAALFAVSSPEGLTALVARVQRSIRGLGIPHPGSSVGIITVSIGSTAVSRADWVDPDTAFRRADAALYDAKRAGRDRAVAWVPGVPSSAHAR